MGCCACTYNGVPFVYIPTLQEVTDAGNVTDNIIGITGGGAYSGAITDALSFGYDPAIPRGWIDLDDGGVGAELLLNPGGGNVGVGGITTAYKFSVGSANGSSQLGFYHDNTDAYVRWSLGNINIQTDEGLNTNTILNIIGKGTGAGSFQVYDQDNEYLAATCFSNTGRIYTGGPLAGNLRFQNLGHADTTFFDTSPSNSTREVKIYGYRAGDALRNMSISCGIDAANRATFKNLLEYYFAGTVLTSTAYRGTSSLWYNYRQIGAINVSPGASGATPTVPDANTIGGYQLDAATEYLYFDTDIHDDWDGASDILITVYFEVNVDNTLGNVADTVDLQLICRMKGDAETACKTQTLEEATTVGQSPQYKQFNVTFAIDWNDVTNPVEEDDLIGFRLNLETDTSEVDDIIVNHFEIKYKSAQPNCIEI